MLGRSDHGHGDLAPGADGLAPKPSSEHFVEAFDGFVFGFQPSVPIDARFLVEGAAGVMPSQAVVDLPSDQLGVLAECGGHRANNSLRIIPVNITPPSVEIPRYEYVLAVVLKFNVSKMKRILERPNSDIHYRRTSRT